MIRNLKRKQRFRCKQIVGSMIHCLLLIDNEFGFFRDDAEFDLCYYNYHYSWRKIREKMLNLTKAHNKFVERLENDGYRYDPSTHRYNFRPVDIYKVKQIARSLSYE